MLFKTSRCGDYAAAHEMMTKDESFSVMRRERNSRATTSKSFCRSLFVRISPDARLPCSSALGLRSGQPVHAACSALTVSKVLGGHQTRKLTGPMTRGSKHVQSEAVRIPDPSIRAVITGELMTKRLANAVDLVFGLALGES
jgi:hypothetical protein